MGKKGHFFQRSREKKQVTGILSLLCTEQMFPCWLQWSGPMGAADAAGSKPSHFLPYLGMAVLKAEFIYVNYMYMQKKPNICIANRYNSVIFFLIVFPLYSNSEEWVLPFDQPLLARECEHHRFSQTAFVWVTFILFYISIHPPLPPWPLTGTHFCFRGGIHWEGVLTLLLYNVCHCLWSLTVFTVEITIYLMTSSANFFHRSKTSLTGMAQEGAQLLKMKGKSVHNHLKGVWSLKMLKNTFRLIFNTATFLAFQWDSWHW